MHRRGIRPLIGCRLDLFDAPSPARLSDRSRWLWAAVAFAQPRQDAGRERRLRAEPRRCRRASEGIAFIAWPQDDLAVFETELPRLREALTSLRHVAASWLYRGDDNARIERLDRLARKYGCTILATNDVHYHAPDRRPLQDVVTCIREKTTIANAGYLLEPECRAAFEIAGGDGPAVRALAARDLSDARVCGLAPLQPRRASLRISQGDGARRTHAAGASRASHLERRRGALARRHSRKSG